jgi:hypothetical protein
MDSIYPYDLPTADSPDVVFRYGKNEYLAVEIETNAPEAGACQAIKYRALICAEKRLNLDDSSVKAALVAFSVPPRLKIFCKRYGIICR